MITDTEVPVRRDITSFVLNAPLNSNHPIKYQVYQPDIEVMANAVTGVYGTEDFVPVGSLSQWRSKLRREF